MGDGRDLLKRAIIALASTGLLVAGGILAVRSSATGRAGPDAGTDPLPAALSGQSASSTDTQSSSAPVTDPTESQTSSSGAVDPTAPPLVPVSIDLPFHSSHYPDGVSARITSHPLNSDDTLYVPADPKVLNWASNDAPLGSSRGTTIITGHVNYVIDGQTVVGALGDLSEYAASAIGEEFTVRAATGERLRYRIIAGREYSKDELAGSAKLRATLYDQTSVFGEPGKTSGRLLLVSCGGVFDPATGEYEDNVFLYALPV